MTARLTVATLARLMPPELPQSVDISRLADADDSLRGYLRAERMDRVLELVSRADDDIKLELAFSRDDSGAVLIAGTFSVTLEMLCQRCLQAMTVELAHDIHVIVIRDSGELAQLDSRVEPLLQSGNIMDLKEFVEDEILLALPIAPLHKPQQCSGSALLEKNATKRENPFAMLRDKIGKQDT